MCGIVAIYRHPVAGAPPDLDPDREAALIRGMVGDLPPADAAPGELVGALDRLRTALVSLDRTLRGQPAFEALIAHRSRLGALEAAVRAAEEAADAAVTARLAGVGIDGTAAEQLNRVAVGVRDAAWAVRVDRLGSAADAVALGAEGASPAGRVLCRSLAEALRAIDRLEVRGRDSAGVHILVTGHGLDPATVRALAAGRTDDPLFRSGAVRVLGDLLSITWKAAAEIGELGDNTRVLREAISGDPLFEAVCGAGEVRGAVLGHTRWASVGIISEANAHPVNSDTGEPGDPGDYCVAALNGDVDNHADLVAAHGLHPPAGITTDAKVIPALWSAHLRRGADATGAFRATVGALEGSVAVAGQSAADPDRLHLALRGSGQALYVGFAPDAWIVASEPYGLVELTDTYLRMDGEAPAHPGTVTSRGQVVTLDLTRPGDLAAVGRTAVDGTPLPVTADELTSAGITTRDIDRGSFPHYLLKELHDAPRSFRTTLRGRVGDGRVTLGGLGVPDDVAARVRAARRIRVIGQGTAAVAAEATAAAIAEVCSGAGLDVAARCATELSGFELTPDMSEVVVVAISQSGTTTDTNRTVELARSRGAVVIAIVNRRGSDLCDRADAVIWTADGRDIEMSVPSTKAFYAQVAAGWLLALALADAHGTLPATERSRLLDGLGALPAAMEEVLARRDRIAAAARWVLDRRSWAVVGNGRLVVAARELRIKLSELCYRSIAWDVTEDKKHIDLSAEPFILVLAAGLSEGTASDVAKEVAIYRAHRAAPVVITDAPDDRWRPALEVIEIPSAEPELAFVLATMAGHLFGYEAALAIDAQARRLRAARGAVEALVSEGVPEPETLAEVVAPHAEWYFSALASGELDGNLDASVAARLASVLRYAVGWVPLEVYATEHGRVGTPSVLVGDLLDALTRAIDELRRPIDAIKHQAKTVTVGISRTEEGLVGSPLVAATLSAGAARDALTWATVRTLAALAPAVDRVTGWTRYRIDGDRISVVDKGGIATGIPSRADVPAPLRGTKRRVATERAVLVARGATDGRTVIIVPEIKGATTTGICLLHVAFVDRLPPEVAREVLAGYRDRYRILRDVVCETEPTFRDDVLGRIDVVDLLCEPPERLAERWRGSADGGSS